MGCGYHAKEMLPNHAGFVALLHKVTSRAMNEGCHWYRTNKAKLGIMVLYLPADNLINLPISIILHTLLQKLIGWKEMVRK